MKLNKFGVCEFKNWISNEKIYVKKSLRNKKKTETVDIVEKLPVKLYTEFSNAMLFYVLFISNPTINCLQTEKSRLNKYSTIADQHVFLSTLS